MNCANNNGYMLQIGFMALGLIVGAGFFISLLAMFFHYAVIEEEAKQNMQLLKQTVPTCIAPVNALKK